MQDYFQRFLVQVQNIVKCTKFQEKLYPHMSDPLSLLPKNKQVGKNSVPEDPTFYRI